MKAAVSWRTAWEESRHPSDSPEEHDQAVATVFEAFPGVEVVPPEELSELEELRHQQVLLDYWNAEAARVAGGFVNVLNGWSWLERRKPCTVCGSDCIALDPQGRAVHPNCSAS